MPKKRELPKKREPKNPQVRRQLGDNIRNCRLAKGWSQDRLAARIDRSTKYMSSIENGKVSFGVDILVEIVAALSVTIGEIFANVPGVSVAADHSIMPSDAEQLSALLGQAQSIAHRSKPTTPVQR